MLEPVVDIAKELAVMVVRKASGETRCYPAVEMAFDARANILDTLLSPSHLPSEIVLEAQRLASEAVTCLQGVGIFGVELFLTGAGEILVNEIAPRPHNSGHHTIEACMTSQFEQHIRAVLNLPLGSTEQLCAAATLNILGTSDELLDIQHFAKALQIDGVSVHLYGKNQSRPFRKMGHITILDTSFERLQDKVLRVKASL
jgi:5-(carboxyamino)imidazole ribonucleotide synthase